MAPELYNKKTPFVRTDFSDDAQWAALLGAATVSGDNSIGADIAGLSDPELDEATVDQIVKRVRAISTGHVYVADKHTFASPEKLILAVQIINDSRVASFRVTPQLLGTVEANLAQANLDFDDFVRAADESGIFRGLQTARERRKIPVAELIKAAENNQGTDALRQFREFLATRRMAVRSGSWEIQVVPDIRTVHRDISERDFARYQHVVGLEDFLTITSRGGQAATLMLPDRGGFWVAIVDSVTLTPIAAMSYRP